MKRIFGSVLLLILFGLLTAWIHLQQGEFHRIVHMIFIGESAEELSLISMTVYNQNGIL